MDGLGDYMMKTKKIRISRKWAIYKNWPVLLSAKILKETEKAYYLFGKAILDPSFGICSRCGRTLTHPGSIKLGIGPECLKNWGLREQILQNLSPEEIEQAKTKISHRKVEGWIPKSQVEYMEDDPSTVITIPENHPMLKKDECKRKAYLQGSKMIIEFPYNKDDLFRVRTLYNRRFDNQKKVWIAPPIIENIEKLKNWGFELSQDLLKIISTVNGRQASEMAEIEVNGLKKDLYPFQKKGVAFIEERGGKALVADEMGLGKTIQALAWLQLHPELRPAVIIVPASLKLNWNKEIKETITKNCKTLILNGKNTHPIDTNTNIIIINYDILFEKKVEKFENPKAKKKKAKIDPNKGWLKELMRIRPKVLILDECHLIKNNTALRTEAVKILAKGIPHILGLSGTPIVSRPAELYNAIKLINPYLFPSWWKFAHRYCGARHNGFGWDFSGASNTDELHEKLTKSIMIRRLKRDVLSDLPDKIRSFVPMEISNDKEYEEAEQNLIDWLRKNQGEEKAERADNAETLVRIEVLKQLAVKGKLKRVIEWIKDFVESDGKLVVFATHKNVIDSIYESFKKTAVKVDGSVSGTNRQEAVEEFQNNSKIRLFVGNIKAAGVGITLTAASSVAFIELPWTPGELDQAEDRCHRIGQKDSVNIYYLLAQGTIEEEIAYLLDSKRKILDSILDGKVTDEKSLLTELINSFTKKN